MIATFKRNRCGLPPVLQSRALLYLSPQKTPLTRSFLISSVCQIAACLPQVGVFGLQCAHMFNAYFRATTISFAILAVSFLYLDLWAGFSYTYWWWDSYEHLLGGIVVGLFALWLGTLRFRYRISLMHTVFFVLVIGLLWEGIEVVYPLGKSIWFSYGVDTVKDLILDVLGGVIAWYWSKGLKV